MSTVVSTTKLHLNKREATFAVPLYITAMVAVISVLISLLFLRAGSVPGSAEWIESSRMNPGMIYALSGFLVYLGVQSVATTFPFALTLGSTRRSFAAGTLVWNVIMSAYLAVVFAVMLMLELATNHWFAGFYIFDIIVLGAGDLRLLIPIVFLSTLLLLTVGGVFGASWVRYGANGPVVLGVGIGIVIILALIVLIPQLPSMLASFELWWLAIAAVVAILASSLGTWTLLRSATVR
ncbi:hypothetical protein [Homoserinimonas sp. OAct 916]|uniref:hypothetical protein n=1 Tax=Homoserinimonas sp. OAct 916 TaxID=2211450 RepID=UPI000DBE8707|nr:hypothetical protein [Homoserinimonas sp. OAct 916]